MAATFCFTPNSNDDNGNAMHIYNTDSNQRHCPTVYLRPQDCGEDLALHRVVIRAVEGTMAGANDPRSDVTIRVGS